MKTTTLLTLLTTTLVLWTTGCQQTSQTRPRTEPSPTVAPAPSPPKAGATRTECTEPTSGLVRLSKQMPAEAHLGETFEYQLVLMAQDCVANVVVTDQVPEGASLVKSEPSAQVDGDKLTWRLSPMDLGQSGVIKVWLKAEKEGTLTSCAVVSADPRVCSSIFVGKATLVLDKTGPETAMLGSTVNYTIQVSNTGSTIAHNVVVVDTVPEGLESANGQKELRYQIGDLGPKESKSITIPLRAAQRGRHCNAAVATSSNAGEAKDEVCTTVLVPGLKVAKTGDTERFLGRNATYKIVVSNVGDTALTDVNVIDSAPPQTRIVSASGATVSGNQALWRIPSLAAGQERSFEVVLTSAVAGNHCNGVTATSGPLRETAEACTVWRGVGAVLLEVVDDPDPIQVDEETTYTIRVTNQGTADLTNLGVSAEFAEQMTPVSSPQGTVSGQGVRFPGVARLAPKQAFTYTIKVKGAKPGDSRNKVSLTADGLTTPVVEEESSRVY